MYLKRLLAVAIFAAGLASAAFAQQKPSFLILGTFHFRGSDSDLMGNRLPDVESEKRQKEIEAIVETLARFRPTRIAVEVPAGNTKIQEGQAMGMGQAYVGETQRLLDTATVGLP